MNPQANIHVLSRGVLVDDGHILVCKTLDINPPFYFLPGGHIENGESAEQTVKREILEETGQACQVGKLLGCLEYSFEPGHSSICHNHEYNFFFLVNSPSLKVGQAIPQMEKHIKVLWHPMEKIKDIDFRPEPLKALLPKWISGEKEFSFHSEMV